jgi:hypothetical protein
MLKLSHTNHASQLLVEREQLMHRTHMSHNQINGMQNEAPRMGGFP